jgi:heme/copper-type cytochrome/quinol oxidase subunit 2
MFWVLAIFNWLFGGGLNRAEASNGGPTPPPSTGGLIKNPISVNTLDDLIDQILGVVVQIGLPVVAVAIVYAGFLFVTARGNETQLTNAKKAFLWTVIGAAIVLGAFVIKTAIKSTVEGLK